jgi:hypothetical protein
MWRRFAHRLAITPEGRIPPMVAESASPAWRPLSKTAALARTGRNGREAAEPEGEGLAEECGPAASGDQIVEAVDRPGVRPPTGVVAP